jgi:hypothetical protein
MRVQSVLLSALSLLVLAGVSQADNGPQHKVKQAPPVKMGTSGGSKNDKSTFYCCGGTLGSLVLRDGVLSILSNNHVLGRSGSAVAGEDTVQPGLIDSNCSATNSNIVGDYAGNLVPLGTANVDAAIATARSNVDASGAILDVGVPVSTVQAPTINLPVKKSGRTTGLTTGAVKSINTTVTVQYQKGCGTGQKFNVSFTGQIVTGAMSAGGDSGSLLVSNDGTANPVGLLFAGNSTSTIYNKASAVVSAFSAGGHSFSFVGTASDVEPTDPPGLLTPSQESIDKVLAVQFEHEVELMRRPNVIGVGVASAENDPTQAVLMVYVTLPEANQPAPAFPGSIDGVPVRVELTDPFVAQ